MRIALLRLVLACATTLISPADCEAVLNSYGKWVLHFAGEHNPSTNDCSLEFTDCVRIVGSTMMGSGRYDVYVVGMDLDAITQTRFGLCCDGSIDFYGWTGCSDSEDPTPGWPGCGEGIILAWGGRQYGPFVIL